MKDIPDWSSKLSLFGLLIGVMTLLSNQVFAVDPKVADRAESIIIKQISLQIQQDPYCLEFYWTATDGDEKRIYDQQTYIYCPGKAW
ncbi:MAG TPA: hypothetical protein VIH18_13630 [Candidatus Binatia bacterium]|jgi:hypothetical protein